MAVEKVALLGTVFFCAVLVYRRSFAALFRGSYKPVGGASSVRYSEVEGADLYVPVVFDMEINHGKALLACDTDGADAFDLRYISELTPEEVAGGGGEGEGCSLYK